jgi:electron-transferring-flavoprotein dehydrogenase
VAALQAGREADSLTDYEDAFRASWIYSDLDKVKNVKPMWSKLGLAGGVALGAVDMWLRTLFGFGLGTWKHGKADYATLKPAAQAKKIDYPKPDGVLSFDRLTNVAFSATNHEEDQLVHLRLRDPSVPVARTCLSMTSRPSATVRPASMKWCRKKARNRASRSTTRIACTARPATSRTRPEHQLAGAAGG